MSLKKKRINILLISTILIIFPFFVLKANEYKGELDGRILLQVEEKGEAWYVNPLTQRRHYLGSPSDAFSLMKNLGLGISETDFTLFNNEAPTRLSGKILLRVQASGQAYYVNPIDLKMYYLSRPSDAFSLMRNLGLGITNSDLANIPVESEATNSYYIESVPFSAQAPFGDWQDPRQQDACEEASVLMALKWARNEDLSQQEALEYIINISNYLKNKYGEFRDTSSSDTLNWIIRDYFSYDKAFIKYNIEIQDILFELSQSNLVIVPINGQVVNNPYFTPPGPSRHMLVILGYDAANDLFITNDPGTRQGRDLKYDSQTLFKAIRDYPTGYKEKIIKEEKNMIVVRN
jgi:hypothetical protein